MNHFKNALAGSLLSILLLQGKALSQDIGVGVPKLPVGFEHADTNGNGVISRWELKVYLTDRLDDPNIPMRKIFEAIDLDSDNAISESEFDKRHSVLEKILGDSYEFPPKPEPGFKPYSGLDQPVDDLKILGAIYHPYAEMVNQEKKWRAAGWAPVDMRKLPRTADIKLPKQEGPKPSLDQICKATVVIGGGGDIDNFFMSGAVIVSPDGLALTNYHVASSYNDKLVALLSNGKVVRVSKILAGDPQRDVAIVQLEGENFPWVGVADRVPAMADDIFMIHHTESRFYTYDRGYVKRYPLMSDVAWLEISADYAPGGSGCGIFNADHQLVGLVSMIMMGDGPTLANEDLTMSVDEDEPEDTWDIESDEDEEYEEYSESDSSMLVVKLAVPLQAVHSLIGKKADQ